MYKTFERERMSYESEYKVRFERLEGNTIQFHCAGWDNEKGARKFFDSLKNEKEHRTVWAELCFASIVDDALDEVLVVDDFERRVVEIMGHKIVG